MEIKTIQNEQKISVLQNQIKNNIHMLSSHTERLDTNLASINDLKIKKLNISIFETETERLDKLIDDLTL